MHRSAMPRPLECKMVTFLIRESQLLLSANHYIALNKEDFTIQEMAVSSGLLGKEEARLHNEHESNIKPGVWSADGYRTGEWLQVDLGKVTMVTAIATQGRPTDLDEWVKSYSLKYSNDGSFFHDYFGGKVLDGNRDRNTVVKRDLVPPINARYVRVYPKTWYEEASLRMELYGCKSGIVNMAFLMDSSGSTTRGDWSKMKSFVSATIADMLKMRNANRFAVVSYSTEAQVEFDFNDVQGTNATAAKYAKLVQSIPHHRGLISFIDKALIVANKSVFTEAAGMKLGASQIYNMNNTTAIASQEGDCSGSAYPTATGLIVLGVFYIIMTIVSFTGNILVICTVVINRRMHTVTNYLIINMAVADLLLTIFNMPSTTASFLSPMKSWLAGDIGIALCKVIPFIQSVSVGSSVLNMNVIAIDRFFAVVFPLHRYVTFPVAYVMMGVVLVVAIGVSAPFLYAMNVIKYSDGTLQCIENWGLEDPSNSSAPKDYTIVLFLFFYAIPLIVISVLYSVVIYKLWIRKVPGQRSETNEQQAIRSKKKVLRMLLVVVIVFAVCWLPLYVSQFMYFFGSDPCGPPIPLSYFGYFIGHANSAINPCLYGLFNENYRKGFRDLLMCRCGRGRVNPAGATTVGFDNTYISHRGSIKLKVTSSTVNQRLSQTYSE
ncbi:hypothetical protein QZH41_004256 [Actinostola sp. cb2023]|nr:hypothetical protein QZH41_004256 [Actinostola sp. cb2023]